MHYKVKNQSVDIVTFLLSFESNLCTLQQFLFFDKYNNILLLLSRALLNIYDFQHTFPRTLESLVLNMLGPVGAEILTRKFDEMDQQTTKEEQSVLFCQL
jgi:hypothetical protein